MRVISCGRFPEILDRFIGCIEAIRFLHLHGQKHGDIRRDHIIVEHDSGEYRWIDFDYNYHHRENMFGYDLFGLGNILLFIAGKGDVLTTDLRAGNHPALSLLSESDFNIVFRNRVANLKKIYPYIPDRLNTVLLHFSRGRTGFMNIRGSSSRISKNAGCFDPDAKYPQLMGGMREVSYA
jgi:hypothetical protein